MDGTLGNWIIEHEGWLYKRNAGYNHEEAQADLTEKFRNGKGEKKRYFILYRKKADETSSEQAELRWYTNTPQGKKKGANGTLAFDASHIVKVVDGVNMEIKTREQTYYFRPISDPLTAESRTTVAQWKSAIEYAITRLREAAIAGKYKSDAKVSRNPLTKMKSLIQSKSSSNLSQAESEIEGNVLPVMRRGDLGEGEAAPNSFFALWTVNGIDGYNSLMEHFGPLQTDLQRVYNHVKSRVGVLSEQCHVLEKNRIQVMEPILVVQKTTREALTAVYTDNRDRLDVLAPIVVQLTEESLKPIENLMADIKEELENVVRFYGKYTQKLERIRKAVIQSTKEVKEKEEKYSELTALAKAQRGSFDTKLNDPSEAQVNNSKTFGVDTKRTKDVKERIGFLPRSFSFSLRGNNTKPEVDPSVHLKEIADSVAAARQNRREQEIEFEHTEKKITKNMKAAMEKLEKLEKDALTKLKAALERLTTIETDFFKLMRDKLDVSAFISMQVAGINPEVDMKYTTEFLLKEAKKNQKANRNITIED